MARDAIVLVDGTADEKIAGLTLRERGVRVAKKAGAERVVVIELGGERSRLEQLEGTRDLLVVRADQLVHPPLVMPLVDKPDDAGLAIAVGDDDAYAGALLARGDDASATLARLGAGESDAAIAEGASKRVHHGAIARHPARTADERRAAHAHLYRILDKPQDNAITRHLFRPVSKRLTKLLVWTPITPNQLSVSVAIVVAVGIWLTARESMASVIAGTTTILGATYLDCCDGEIARVKLLSSKFGAWFDTVVDELTSIAYMAALGWHCHLYFGKGWFGDLDVDLWLVGLVVGVVTYVTTVFFVYYVIIVGVGSANSQDYAAKFDVVPGSRPETVRLRPVVEVRKQLDVPRWLRPVVEFLPNIPRRDFIVWMATFYAVVHWTHISFFTHLAGGVVTFVVTGIGFVRLVLVRRRIRRSGQILEAPS